MTGPMTQQPKSRRGIIVAVAVIVCGLAAGAIVLGGILPLGGGNTHPPCDQLPSAAQARDALEDNPGLVSQLRDAGSGVSVGVDSPGCDNGNQALIDVTYSTGEERDHIDAVLTRSDGFGVPVYVHER